MIDAKNQTEIAARARWKSALSGVLQLMLGLPLSLFSLSSLRISVTQFRVDWWLLFLSLTLLACGWFFAATGLRRLRETFDKRFYVRAGPDGISFCIPEGKWSSLLLDYRLIEESLSWGVVKKYYPYASSVNGVPIASEVRIETLVGDRYSIPSLYFAASREDIATRIKTAAQGKDISVLDSLAKIAEDLKRQS